jgi:hypothetical protein
MPRFNRKELTTEYTEYTEFDPPSRSVPVFFLCVPCIPWFNPALVSFRSKNASTLSRRSLGKDRWSPFSLVPGPHHLSASRMPRFNRRELTTEYTEYTEFDPPSRSAPVFFLCVPCVLWSIGLAPAANHPRLDPAVSRVTFPAVTKFADIAEAALRLPDKDRLHLADRLLGSLPPPAGASDPDQILAEALRRDAELESGNVQPLSENAFWAGVRRAQR